ncbi:CLUMA_CG003332, isoform A [Clunio marinus]|uniref:CLUMA_CG003332, isoform A n=1 Tax=Clunio marinus TaxID=568069 RepID=A0A1J1HNM9_9DIPT|nr:CLUMA_CG003332, isoform A [Clunio marinus]
MPNSEHICDMYGSNYNSPFKGVRFGFECNSHRLLFSFSHNNFVEAPSLYFVYLCLRLWCFQTGNDWSLPRMDTIGSVEASLITTNSTSNMISLGLTKIQKIFNNIFWQSTKEMNESPYVCHLQIVLVFISP